MYERGRWTEERVPIRRKGGRSRFGRFGDDGAEDSGEYAEDLAASMLASTLGIEFDPDAAWNERKQVYEMSHHIIGGTSVTAATAGDTAGRWTCVVAAAVFRFS